MKRFLSFWDVDDEQKGDARENLSDGIEANFDWVIEKRVAASY